MPTLQTIFKESCSKFSQFNSLLYADEKSYTYKELCVDVHKIATMLNLMDIKQNDKVAIFSQNMPNWGKAFFALQSMGVVAVPILPDFHQDQVKEILRHSEAKAIFVSENLFHQVEKITLPSLKHRILLDRFSVIQDNATKEDILKQEDQLANIESAINFDEFVVKAEDLASIIYTSGTTGNSKGVMLTHKNLVFMAQKLYTLHPIDTGDRFLSLLPLSHTMENSIGFIYPIMNGSSIHYLRKAPTAPVLLPALKKVKPTVIASVPLIIEKIYWKSVLPKFEKSKVLKTLYGIGPFRKVLNKAAGKKLMETFGGEIKFFGIGGSKLDPKVEQFLMEAKFPYAIGYGLTETSPLLAGANPSMVRLQSTGPAMEGVTLRIANPDPKTGEGEVQAKGDNVMSGYYKEPELTAQVFTEDGWFKTGDLGTFDKDNYLFIRGRIKNMIVGPSGENVYPEEIESLINNLNIVKESLVVERAGKLVGLVHLDHEILEEQFKNFKEDAKEFIEEKINEVLKEIHIQVNSRLNKFSQLQMVIAQAQPFEKTPTLKIKRFLYH